MISDPIFSGAAKVVERVDFSLLEGKTVLITGATGLLGTNLLACLALLKESGMRVEVFGHCHSTPVNHTLQIAERGSFNLVQGSNFKPADIVIHAAGYAQPAVFMSNPAETIGINTTLTQKLLEGLKPDGRFLFLSSSEVYSGLSSVADELQIGTTNPYHSRACYIEGKRCGEALVNAHRKQNGISTASARVALTYGPGTKKHDTRVLNQFIEKALVNKKINLMDSGEAIRTYCYVSDAVETLWNIVLHGTQAVYNVGGVSIASIAELASMVGHLMSAEVVIPEKSDGSPGASQEVRMSLARIREEFGKTDYVALEAGLKTTIEYQRELYRET
jgi:UDP-glucuronate decarboxylase